ncbi:MULTISPECIES: NAD(P)/FAD-dependent oxidoreductase [unclassified Rhodococcus (in: high G+C Gram-positive bacteria)]|uniref:flavin-containing monooxygenase n=1 Tax=unclassified Rhodococcus (in: high G+C Gram-positive bacteria) TaxID=192944 RepID=UPI001639CF75|nr:MULTISPECIES: NAD(P)/FAD-dependent oxidoreductase [unclassified Rhodococcus (in: high G+C Gram-positive bacteria)]MBC2639509.1 NAD(P)/FAD-dependent oxidoreductase [Rhodococcus sp. 3A]MBC2895746.1 NAD(P)/FAD-dependent oxidoreductase [Rhodococcus sp. 4CII]
MGGEVNRCRVLVIGTGFSGLGTAIQLRKRGRDDFILLEAAQEVGGTWRENTYPGCACDIPSHLYSFSFEPNSDWTQMWSGQAEIFAYLRGLADKYDLRRNIHFGRTMTGGYWDAGRQRWHVHTASGDEYVAQFLVSGIGALHIPNVPDLPGAATFAGPAFHSARWNHDFDLRGKRVAVIGTGASAVQFVPEIIDDVAELQMYQRTPPWVIPRLNFDIPPEARRLFGRVPLMRRMVRAAVYWLQESLALGFNGHRRLMRPIENLARRNLNKTVTDPVLRRKLTPSYDIGCKRILGSGDYYPALVSPKSEVITEGIAEIRPGSIVAGDGRERAVDAIIYATGFHVTDGFDSVALTGVDGRSLADEWAEHGIRTHLGITVAGYPNAFFLLGPNTGLGHNSVVFMIESQIRYVLQLMDLVDRRGADSAVVRQAVQSGFNTDIQRKLAKGVWSSGGCVSWYLDSHGVNRTIWPGSTVRYWRRTRSIDPADFEFTPA